MEFKRYYISRPIYVDGKEIEIRLANVEYAANFPTMHGDIPVYSIVSESSDFKEIIGDYMIQIVLSNPPTYYEFDTTKGVMGEKHDKIINELYRVTGEIHSQKKSSD